MNRLLCIIVVLLSFIVLLSFMVACKESPESSQSSSTTTTREESIQQAVYNLCKEKGGVPIVINDEVTDCIFKENRTNSWE